MKREAGTRVLGVQESRHAGSHLGERPGTDCRLASPGGSNPADTWVLDLWLTELKEHISIILRHQVCGDLLWQPWDTGAGSEPLF